MPPVHDAASFWIDVVGFWLLVAIGVLTWAPPIARFVVDTARALRARGRGQP